MKRNVRRWVLIGVALAAVVAGVLIATVGSGGDRARPRAARSAAGRPARGDLAIAASYLGVSRRRLQAALRSGESLAALAQTTRGRSASGLLDALVAAKEARLALAVGSRRLTAEQRGARLRTLRLRTEAEIHRAGIRPTGVRYLAVARSYLGLSAGQLRAAHRRGRSLAQIADATPGRSASGLIAALVADRRRTLAQSVASGQLTAGQAARIASHLETRVTHQVDRKPLLRG